MGIKKKVKKGFTYIYIIVTRRKLSMQIYLMASSNVMKIENNIFDKEKLCKVSAADFKSKSFSVVNS